MQVTDTTQDFRRLCADHGIAVTHQRQVLYEVMHSMHGHPSPEDVYDRMKQRIPSVSLATVYKNIHLFVASGVFRELSLHHGTLRIEMNRREHHHQVCSVCRSIVDIDDEDLGLALPHNELPGGFLVERLAVDIIGVCATCRAAQKNFDETTGLDARPTM